MATSSTGAVRRVASARVAGDPARSPSKRPSLRLVPRRRPDGGRSRVVRYLPAIMVVVALLVVVVGQAILANGQVRMTVLDQQLQAARANHSAQVESVAKLETPSRIVTDATANGKLTRPSHVTQLPYVPLNTPIATPNVTPAAGSTVTTATLAVSK